MLTFVACFLMRLKPLQSKVNSANVTYCNFRNKHSILVKIMFNPKPYSCLMSSYVHKMCGTPCYRLYIQTLQQISWYALVWLVALVQIWRSIGRTDCVTYLWVLSNLVWSAGLARLCDLGALTGLWRKLHGWMVVWLHRPFCTSYSVTTAWQSYYRFFQRLWHGFLHSAPSALTL